MSRYKIKSNGEKFTQQEIVQQRNFEQFLSAYKKQASVMTAGTKISLSIMAIGVLATVLVLTMNNNNGNQTTVTEKKPAFVSPPLKGIDIPYTTFTVDADKGGELTYKTGSVLKVPPHAFLGSDGKPVSGKITLRYREFHDVGDIFLSGIPMTYDSAGTQYHFESAGMMELLAFNGNDPVKVNPDKKINVELASKQPGDYFNVYYLDTNKRNWDFVKRDTAGVHNNIYKKIDEQLKKNSPKTVAQKLKDDISNIKNEITGNERKKPLEPKKAEGDRFKVKIDVKEDEFPEIAAYREVLFQVAPWETRFKPEYSKITWDDVEVAHGANEDHYVLTFKRGNEKHSFECAPVLEGKNYDDAKNLFDKLHEKYLSFRDERQKKLKEKQKQLEYVHQQLQDKNNTLNDSMSLAGAMSNAMMDKENRIMRVFEVANFGFWNCDCPTALPKGMLVNAEFTDSTGKPLKFEHVYLVEKGKNALFTYYNYAFNQFRYNPAKQNMVWAVAPGNKLAFFSVEAFGKLKVKKDGATFVMKLIDKKFASADEVKELMKI